MNTSTRAPLDRRTTGNRGDERRAALLQALDELLRESESLEAINVAELSRRAGVTRSAFYFYFESKATAVAALLEELYDDAAGATDLLVEAQGDPEVRLRKVIAGLFDAVDRRPHAHRALLEARATSAAVRGFWDAERATFARAIAGMITAERAAGRAPAGADADALAAVLLDLNDRAIESHVHGGGPGREQHIEVLTSIWLRSIYAADPPHRRPRRAR